MVLDEQGSAELRQYFERESIFTATSLCFAEALGLLKVRRFYQKGMTDKQYFSGCDDLMAYVAEGSIEIEDIEVKDRSVFDEVETLTRKYKAGKPKDKTIDISDAFQIASVKRNYFPRFPNTDSKPILIAGDQALANAARDEELRVWNCMNEPPPEEIKEA